MRCFAIVLPKELRNILAKLKNGAIEYSEIFDGWRYQILELLHRSGATESAELFQEGRYGICTVITLEWRYRNCRVVSKVVL
jgi:hypothetical protein